MRPLLLIPLLAAGCTTATTLADDFVAPIEERLGDPASPAPGTVEARLADLEARLAGAEAATTDAEARIAALEGRADAADATLADFGSSVDEALALASAASSVEIWGIDAYTDRRVFNPDGSSGTARAFPVEGATAAAIRLEYADCAYALLSVTMTNTRDVGDRIGLTIGPDVGLKVYSRTAQIGGGNASGTLAVTTQLWVATEGKDRLYVRTIPGTTNPTTATLHHVGCITGG
jgi:uncharacterized coiled-coil protein SlyX